MLLSSGGDDPRTSFVLPLQEVRPHLERRAVVRTPTTVWVATLDLCGNHAGYTLAFQSQRSRRRKVEAVSSRLASRSYVLAMPMSRLEETNGCEI